MAHVVAAADPGRDDDRDSLSKEASVPCFSLLCTLCLRCGKLLKPPIANRLLVRPEGVWKCAAGYGITDFLKVAERCLK